MANFNVVLSPAAARDLDALTEDVARSVVEALSVLADDPFPRGKLVKKMKGSRDAFYRLRVDKHRAFYEIDGATVVVLRVIARKDVEEYLKRR